MKKPVSFEIAKLLKEKGFDEISKNLWHFNSSDCIKMSNKNSENLGFSAPTIAKVVRWIYDKHGIWISPRFLEAPYCSYWIINNRDKSIEITKSNWLSLKEAYEAGIEYVIENLI